MKEHAVIKERFAIISPFLNERLRRMFAAAEVLSLGHGGASIVSRATGVSFRAIRQGKKELREEKGAELPVGRVRKKGGGRKRTVEKDVTLKSDLESLVEPTTRGDPESPLRWTCKSIRKLAEELQGKGHQTSHRMVRELLHEMGYSLQSNKKTLEGSSHADRNAQFEYINERAQDYQKRSQPVISVDTKKKELVGNFQNGGREWRPKGEPEKVKTHDFLIPELGRVAPYGVYDIANNLGSVNVGISADTAEFAVESIRRWWNSMGKESYPSAKELLITADGGGSNGSRLRLWKAELQKLATETGLSCTVCHFPPGTSKWNKIEHRLFSFVSQNWRGKPLLNHETIINLIASTTTRKGLKVQCCLDSNIYEKGIKVSDKEMRELNIQRHDFHGEWNYTIMPKTLKSD